ncbi:MAG TPA: ATP-binding protein [Lentimicrobium sp.]|nr:ATP-binding protein [Lentimicrobium sp.]
MAIPNLKIKTWGLQSKILILFLIALASVLTAAYFVRENERILRRTLNNLSEPEERLTLLHDVLTIIPEAENNLRYFALTGSSQHYVDYEYLIDSVESNIRKLTNNYHNDASTKTQLDSISLLLKQRKQIIAAYIQIRSERESFDFTKLAYNKVREEATDSVLRQKTTSTTIITVYDTLPPDSITVKNKDDKEKGGLFTKIKKVFSKKEEPAGESQSTSVSVVKSTTKIQTDTAKISPVDTSRIKDLQKELSKIKQLDLNNYNRLREKELNLLSNSSLIIDQITDIFKKLERSIIEENEMSSFRARLNASESLFIIGVVSLVSLLLIMLLIILIMISIRKNNRYRKELILANIQANELAKVKEEFLSNMSHEMRTPLNAIIGFTDLLIDTNLAQEQKRYLNAVMQSSRHLLDTVNDILDLSKLVAGKFQIEKRPFNFWEVMKDTLSPFELQAREKGLDFLTACNDETDLLLMGDALRLRQILYNLISNAIKFTNYGSISVKCTVERSNNTALLEIVIEDTGIGIPKDMHESIFEDFQQVETSSARTYGGSGLGLAISRRLARLHHGDIKVESSPGEGSRFILHIRYEISQENPQIDTQAIEVIRTELKNKNLLVIDDDPFSIMLSKIIGEKNEMNVQIAEDGFKAIDLIDELKFDLIMTDLQMPGVTGRDIIKFIRTHSDKKVSSLPVLAFTANKLDRFDEKLLAEGFNEVIQKPFLEDELIERIYFYVSGKSRNSGHYPVKTPDETPSPEELASGKVRQPMEYSLDQVKLFSGGHADQERKIIESFIQSATNSLKEMKTAIKDQNYADIKNVAHRTLTAYQLLKVNDCVQILEKLDKLDLNDVAPESITRLLEELESKNTRLFKHLKRELRNLEKA